MIYFLEELVVILMTIAAPTATLIRYVLVGTKAFINRMLLKQILNHIQVRQELLNRIVSNIDFPLAT